MSPKTENYRSHTANPRKWPKGENRVPSQHRGVKMGAIVQKTKNIALLGDFERELLYHLVCRTGPGTYANLGHARGASAVLFAQALIDSSYEGIVESVDVFETVSHWRSARRKLVEFGVRDRVVPRRGTTDYWGEKFLARGTEFSGLFIDADHSYDWVKADTAQWTKMVKVGGFVCWHDTNQDFSHRAVTEWMQTNPNWVEDKTLHVESIRVCFRRS